MKLRFTLLFIFATVFTCGLRAEFRTWTSTTGTTVEAELIDYNSSTVELRLKEGRVIRININALDDKSRANLTAGKQVTAVATKQVTKEIPREIRHIIWADQKRYWWLKNAEGNLDRANSLTGRYKDENKEGVTVISKGRPVLIPWDKLLRTSQKDNHLDMKAPIARNGAGTTLFRGIVGEEIPWPEMDIASWPGIVPNEVKIRAKANPYKLKDGKLIFDYKADPQLSELIEIRVKPPVAKPGEYIRFGIQYSKQYLGAAALGTKKDKYIPIATVFLILKNGERVKFSLSGFVGPNGDNVTASNYYPWVKLTDEIETCTISIFGNIYPLEPDTSNSVEIVQIKAYKAFYQKD